MKVAVAQISCALGDLSANVGKLRDCCIRAKKSGAELIVFPEMADTGYSMPVIREHARPWTEGAVPVLQETARDLSLNIICGVSERDGSSIYNSQAFINPDGKLGAKYRKTHLFESAPIEEHTCFAPGAELASFALQTFRVGLSICYDLRFPEIYRALACDQHADVLVISSAWPFPRVEHLRVLATARAIENQSYVVVANRVGTDGDVTFCGTSAIIDPYGIIVAAGSSDRDEIIYGELSAEVLRSVRNRMPVFTDRRPELYSSNRAASMAAANIS